MKSGRPHRRETGRESLRPENGRPPGQKPSQTISSRRLLAPFRRVAQSGFVQKPIAWLGTLLGICWASPLTLAGMAIAFPVVLFRGNLHLVRGTTVALLVRGPFADWILHRHPFGRMNAMAIGHIVIAEHDGLSSRVLVHELAHVRQAARWGIVFPFAYLASSLWAALRGKDAYWHNRFEIAARKAEKHI